MLISEHKKAKLERESKREKERKNRDMRERKKLGVYVNHTTDVVTAT